MSEPILIWRDGFEGKAKGGCYVRNDLFKFFSSLRGSGHVPVGIIISDGWNLEVLLEDNGESEEKEVSKEKK